MDNKQVIIIGKHTLDGQSEVWTCLDIVTLKVQRFKFISNEKNFVLYIFCKYDYISKVSNIIDSYLPLNDVHNMNLLISFSTVNIKTNANFLTLFGAPHLDEYNSKMCVLECSMINCNVMESLWSHLNIMNKLQPFFYLFKPFNILMRDIFRKVIRFESRLCIQNKNDYHHNNTTIRNIDVGSCINSSLDTSSKEPQRQYAEILPSLQIIPQFIPSTISSLVVAATTAAAAPSASSPSSSTSSPPLPSSQPPPLLQAAVGISNRSVRNIDFSAYSPLNTYTVIVNNKNEIIKYSPFGSSNVITLEFIKCLLSRIPIVYIHAIYKNGTEPFVNNNYEEIQQIVISIHMSFHLILTQNKKLQSNLIDKLYNLKAMGGSGGNDHVERKIVSLEFKNECELLRYFIHIYCQGELFKNHNFGEHTHFVIVNDYSVFTAAIIFRIIKNEIWHLLSNYCTLYGNYVLLNKCAIVLSPFINIKNIIRTFALIKKINPISEIFELLNPTNQDITNNPDLNRESTLFIFNTKEDFNDNVDNIDMLIKPKYCYYDYYINEIIQAHEDNLHDLIYKNVLSGFLYTINELKLYLTDINSLSNNIAIELNIFYLYLKHGDFFLNSHIVNTHGVFLSTSDPSFNYFKKYLRPHATKIDLNAFDSIMYVENIQKINRQHNLYDRLAPAFASLYKFSNMFECERYNYTSNFNPYSSNKSYKINLSIDNIYNAIINKYQIALNNQAILLGVELICVLNTLERTSKKCIIFDIDTMCCIQDKELQLEMKKIQTNKLYIIIIPWLYNFNYFKNMSHNEFENVLEYFNCEETRYNNISFAIIIKLIYNKYMKFFHHRIHDILTKEIPYLQLIFFEFEYKFDMQLIPSVKNINVQEIHDNTILFEIQKKQYSKTIASGRSRVISEEDDNDKMVQALNKKINYLFKQSTTINTKINFKTSFALKYYAKSNNYAFFNNNLKKFFSSQNTELITSNTDFLNKVMMNTSNPTLSDYRKHFFCTVLWCFYKYQDHRTPTIQDRKIILNKKFLIKSDNNKKQQLLSLELNLENISLFFNIYHIYKNQILSTSLTDVAIEDQACLSLFYEELYN